MIFIFIICALIALLILAIVGNYQEDMLDQINMLKLEVKMKQEQIDNMNGNYKKIYEGTEKLAKTIKDKIK